MTSWRMNIDRETECLLRGRPALLALAGTIVRHRGSIACSLGSRGGTAGGNRTSRVVSKRQGHDEAAS